MDKKINELQELEKELQDLERKKQHLIQMEKTKEKLNDRKKRARRLIETGALAEKYFEIHNLTIEQREQLFKMFSAFVKANKPKNLR